MLRSKQALPALRPFDGIALAFASIARKAKQLKIRRIARSAIGDGNNMINRQAVCSQACGATPFLKEKQAIDIVGARSAAISLLFRAAVYLGRSGNAMCSLWITLRPLANCLASLLRVCGSPLPLHFQNLGLVVLLPISAVLRIFFRVSGMPFSILRRYLAAMLFFPEITSLIMPRTIDWIGRSVLVLLAGRCSMTSQAFIRPNQSLLNVTMPAGNTRKITLVSERRGFFSRNRLHGDLLWFPAT